MRKASDFPGSACGIGSLADSVFLRAVNARLPLTGHYENETKSDLRST
jgi:hypothetical protein